MTRIAELRALVAEVDHAGGCTHPVRLAGATVDWGTGELWEGTVPVACKDRRRAVCPACAARYRADAWHLVAAGLRGGKGVPPEVADHPALFVTFTAPSFGPVHGLRATRPCHPRRRASRCPHGAVLGCTATHAGGDPVLGEPLCATCFDYEGAVLWNAHVGRLWNRTSVVLRRELARQGGLSERVTRAHLRCSYLKVAEFQRRGLVHLHVVVRADGPAGPTTAPPGWVTTETLGLAVAAGATVEMARLDGRARLRWGEQFDVRVIGAGETGGPTDPVAVAAYVAKYAVKSSEPTGALAVRLRGPNDPVLRRLRPHAARLAETAWALGGDLALGRLQLRAHAHTFGYPGHFATKSQRYSTTFGALRSAREAHGASDWERRGEVEGTFSFTGRGYSTTRAARLAEALAEAGGEVPRRFPGASRQSSPPLSPGTAP